MRNKKKDKLKGNNQTEENTQADLEKFIQTFEKPTKIYRLLRTRHAISPIFLQRSLTYMKHRRSVSNAKRKSFKVDSLLERIPVTKEEPDLIQSSPTIHHLKLEFLGYYDGHIHPDVHDVEVEAVLTKIHHHHKETGGAPHEKKISLGKVRIPVNPSENQSSLDGTQSSNLGNVSFGELVSQESFDFTQRALIKSYTLHLFVYIKPGQANGMCNGDSNEIDEPVPKKRKSIVNGRAMTENEPVTYKTELKVYGKHDQCMLTCGEYDLIMQEEEVASPVKNASWETVKRQKVVDSIEMFDACSSLKFRLTWTEDKEGTKPSRIQPNDFVVNNQYTSLLSISDSDSSPLKLKEEGQSTPQKKAQVVYQFLYNENTRQQTDPRDNMRCPWCLLNCEQLYSLMKHIRVFHSRFNIIYVPHPKAAHIHVSLNDSYDGSYAGNPQDLNSHLGFAFARLGPVRRTSVTHVIVYRPKRPAPSLLEFCEPEKENQVCRQIIQGHNRLYYRTATCLPLKPQEIDQDSEDEATPRWLQQKSVNLIDEFTDVNEGEKEMMKMWNLHVMKYAYISDCQMVQACQSFIEEHGRELHLKNIIKNFLVHLTNMFDFSLISPDVVQRTMWQLTLIKDEMEMKGEIPTSD